MRVIRLCCEERVHPVQVDIVAAFDDLAHRMLLHKKHKLEVMYEVTNEPLDGEEGELIEDEGCYIDVCVKSCIGLLATLRWPPLTIP